RGCRRIPAQSQDQEAGRRLHRRDDRAAGPPHGSRRRHHLGRQGRRWRQDRGDEARRHHHRRFPGKPRQHDAARHERQVMSTATSEPQRAIHPGAGRRKGRNFPKGRQVDPSALAEIEELLGTRSRQPDLLIEHLHLVQDKYGCLHARHLAALAHAMRLALVEVYEVASFYAHFDIVMDGETAPPALTVRVCDSLTCSLLGAQTLLAELPQRLGKGVRVVRAPCMGGCHNAPVTAIGHALHEHATVDSVVEAAKAKETHPHLPAYPEFAAYRKAGGYVLLEACLSGKKTLDDI